MSSGLWQHWSSPVIFLPPFFRPIGLHSAYFKSHYSSVILSCRWLCATHILHISASPSSLRLHLSLHIHLHHQHLDSRESCPNPSHCWDWSSESNRQIPQIEFCTSINDVQILIMISPYWASPVDDWNLNTTRCSNDIVMLHPKAPTTSLLVCGLQSGPELVAQLKLVHVVLAF